MDFQHIELSDEGKAELDAYLNEQTASLKTKNFEVLGEKKEAQTQRDQSLAQVETLEAKITELTKALEAAKKAKPAAGGDNTQDIETAVSEATGALKNELEALKAELDSEKTSATRTLIQSEMNMAISQAGVLPEYAEFIGFKMDSLLGIREDDNSKKVVAVLKDDGNPRFGSEGMMTPAHLLAEWKEDEQLASYFKGNQKKGSGAPGGQQNPGTSKNPFQRGESWNVTKQMTIMSENPELGRKLKAEAA